MGTAPLPFGVGNLESLPTPPAPPRGWPPGLLVVVGWCSRSCFLSRIRCSGARMSHAESSSQASCTVPSGGRRGGFRGNQRLSQLIPVELARPAPHAPHTRCVCFYLAELWVDGFRGLQNDWFSLTATSTTLLLMKVKVKVNSLSHVRLFATP